MQEELVTFETAKLAKEKGFNEYTEGYYYPSAFNNNGIPTILADDGLNINKTWYNNFPEGISLSKYKWNSHHPESDFIAVPTQSLLQKWLREVHKIIINVTLDFFNSYTKENIKYSPIFYTYSSDKNRFWLYTDYINSDECTKEIQDKMPIFQNYDTYEEALEVGLQEGLKLINMEHTKDEYKKILYKEKPIAKQTAIYRDGGSKDYEAQTSLGIIKFHVPILEQKGSQDSFGKEVEGHLLIRWMK